MEEPDTEDLETTFKNSEIGPETFLPMEKPIPEGPDSIYQYSEITNGSLSLVEQAITESQDSTCQYSEITNGSLSPLPVPPMEEPVTGSLEFPSQYPEDTLLPMTPLLAPPIQVMENHQQSYDNDRIPDSIFSRSSTSSTTKSCSAASNDSLFSIRIGNNSFSKNHAPKTNLNLCKPEEPKSGQISPVDMISRNCKVLEDEAIDHTITADVITLSQAASQMSHREEPVYSGETSGLEYHSLNHDMSLKQLSHSSSPTLHSDKGGTKTQKSTRRKKKSLCLPCQCPDLCQSHSSKRSRWSGKCFSCSSCTCIKCNNSGCCSTESAWSCKWFTWPRCPTNCLNCKCFTCLSWKSCCCKCSSWPTCKPSFKCFSCPSCPSCKCISCSSCKCISCSSCKCICFKRTSLCC